MALDTMNAASRCRRIALTCMRPTIKEGKMIEKIFESRPTCSRKSPIHTIRKPHEPANNAIDLYNMSARPFTCQQIKHIPKQDVKGHDIITPELWVLSAFDVPHSFGHEIDLRIKNRMTSAECAPPTNVKPGSSAANNALSNFARCTASQLVA